MALGGKAEYTNLSHCVPEVTHCTPTVVSILLSSNPSHTYVILPAWDIVFENYANLVASFSALLRVCRQIHKDAEPIYLSSNLFVLPPQFIYCPPFRAPVERSEGLLLRQAHGADYVFSEVQGRPLFSQQGLPLVRNISIVLCSRGDTGHNSTIRTFWHTNTRLYGMSEPQRSELAHRVRGT